MQFSTKTLLALLPYFLQANAGASGTGTTTRYWDCCKPSCAWPGKFNLAAGSNPVQMCDIKDQPLMDSNAASGCAGGQAYQCSNESPWAVDDNLAYGYAAVNIAGGSEASWCCACYELTFTSGAVAGKKMIVQATNTGSDLSGNQFDISVRLPPLHNLAMIFSNDRLRSQVVALAFSMAAQTCLEPQVLVGVSNMVVLRRDPLVMASRQRSRTAATGDTTGSWELTTQAYHSNK
jgi:hypothetical protein